MRVCGRSRGGEEEIRLAVADRAASRWSAGVPLEPQSVERVDFGALARWTGVVAVPDPRPHHIHTVSAVGPRECGEGPRLALRVKPLRLGLAPLEVPAREQRGELRIDLDVEGEVVRRVRDRVV